jgi:hypothetical protein
MIVNSRIDKLFENFNFINNSNPLIMGGRLPTALFDELSKLVDECREIKNHELACLKQHFNIGMNSYQVSIPSPSVENSFMFPFLNYLGEMYTIKQHSVPHHTVFRKFRLRKHQGHYDGYDLWVNFCNEGDKNDLHSHSGALSGVIYFDNPDYVPTFFENGIQCAGDQGDILIFPSSLKHYVNKLETKKERITLSFNLDRVQ